MRDYPLLLKLFTISIIFLILFFDYSVLNIKYLLLFSMPYTSIISSIRGKGVGILFPMTIHYMVY